MKARGGVRKYDAQPSISDSAEYGIVMVKWWHAMQPDNRQSADAMPEATYVLPDGAWHSLLKAGPNGLISLLTLSAWWGQAMLARTQWQDDSSELWVAFKADLRLSLQAMLNSIPVLDAIRTAQNKRKSTDSGDLGAKPSKRYVFHLCFLAHCC